MKVDERLVEKRFHDNNHKYCTDELRTTLIVLLERWDFGAVRFVL